MERKTQPHRRNIRRSQFRDNTVINQGDTHIHLPAQLTRALTHVIPYPRNEDFVHRSDVVGKLDQLLPRSSEFYSAALCGLGGSGKTQIALDYTYRRCGTHSVFWVHADTEATIINDYKMIARKFGDIDEKLDDEGLLIAVCNRIEAEPEWLLVLDNADDLSLFGIGIPSSSSKTLSNYIPRGPKGLVLWTTRDKRIKGTLVSPIRAVEVGDLSLDEATILLSIATTTTQDKATCEDINNTNELLEALQYHALAISQAGAYMRRTSTSIRQYITMLMQKKTRQTLLEKSEFDRHRQFGAPNSILDTWSISIKRIQQESELAFDLFHTIAYFDNQKFLGDLVEVAGIECGFDWEEGTDALEEAITRLKEFSLIYQRQDEFGHRMYEMHKLVQEAARYSLRMKNPLAKGSATMRTSTVLQDNEGISEAKDESFFAMRALNVISYMSEDLHESGEAQVLGDDYMTHALQVVEWMDLCGEGAAISNKLSAVSDLLGDLNEWKGRALLDKKILAMRQKILGVEHPDTLNSMAHLTISCFGQAFADRDDGTLRFDISYQWKDSRYYINKAYEIGMEVLGLRHKVLGSTHPDTIASWKTIAEIQCGQGHYDAAAKIAQNILDTQQTLYGEKHSNTLAAMEDLAYVFYIQGRYTQALYIREEVLKLQKETAGEKNLATMLAMYNLAISWNQCGRRRDALALMKECYKLQENAFGLFHRLGLGCNWLIEEWEDEVSDGDAYTRDSASLLMELHIDPSMNNN
ncbi:P-loop containing nucleoside triphosphate hydrolase protein [Trichoderma sp. SZMC 28015]